MPQLFLIHFIIAVSWAGQLVLAATDDPVDFETQVRPLLMQHCAQCHGAAVQKKGLRLDAKQAAFKGGDYGAVILPGK
ncbi:MAG: c-type cytochrome domain-containing protein, partial [Planctomycetota bacterium]